MYGLPADFDGSFIAGRRLEQICFTEGDITLAFDGDLAIMVESAFTYNSDLGRAEDRLTKVPVKNSDLMRLLGCQVSTAHGDKDGTLVLIFENGQKLQILDNSQQYESYRIEHGGKTIIV